MKERNGRWEFDGSSAARLWDKSAIGRLTPDGTLLLTDFELIFCKEHRSLEFPDSDWLSKRLRHNSALLEEAAILEALRVPGNKVIVKSNLESMDIEYSESSWALRWPSNSHPNNDPAVSEIRWFHAEEGVGVSDLLAWSIEVDGNGRIPEVLVIDEEQSVVTYRLQVADPIGNLIPPTISAFEQISNLNYERTGSGGAFFPDIEYWPCEAIGIPLRGGRQVDFVELELIYAIGKATNNLEFESILKWRYHENSELTISASILLELWTRGLNTRSGFKFGTAWRCYPGQVGDGHAPWLVVDPSEGSPETWGEACLSSRLASGVNKHWLYPNLENEDWKFLEISRPPSDSRWNNPNRR